jgi:hypothetical protein
MPLEGRFDFHCNGLFLKQLGIFIIVLLSLISQCNEGFRISTYRKLIRGGLGLKTSSKNYCEVLSNR